MSTNIDIFINGKDLTKPAFDSAKTGMAGLGGATEAATGKISAMTVAVGTLIGNLATSALNKMGQFVSSVVSTGISFDNLKQQANIAFTTMLGSAQKAQSFLDEMKSFAAQTPFEFPDLLTASQRMLAMGIQSDKVLPTLTAIGDAVAGLGGSSAVVDRVTTALGQMQAKGKVSAEEMMQLTEAGIPAWDFLAQKIGVSVPEAMDLVSGKAKKTAEDSGQAWQVMGDGVIQVLPKFKTVASGVGKSMEDSRITATTAIDAIVAGMNEKFGGMMEKQSITFGGLSSTIKDTFTQVSGTVIEPFFDLMTEGLQMIVDWTNSPQFTSGVERLTHWVDMAAQGARAFFTDLLNGQPVVDAISHAFAILLPPNVYMVWATARDIFADLMDVITGRISVVEYFGTLWDDVWSRGQRVFAQLSDYLKTNLPAWQMTLGEWGQAAWQWLVDAIPAIITKLGEWADALFGWVNSNLLVWAGMLAKWGQALWQWVVDAWPAVQQTLGQWFTSLIGWYAARLPDFIATTLEWGAALVNWISDAIVGGIDALSRYISGIRERGELEGNSVLEGMAQGWMGILWRWIEDDLIPKIGPSFRKLIDAFANYYPRLLQSLGGLASELGLLLWQWIVDVTPIALRKIADWGGELWGWIRDHKQAWFDHLAEWAKIAWQWIVDIAWPKTKDAIEDWAEALWKWITDNAPKWWEKLQSWAKNLHGWILEVAWPKTKEAIIEWADNLWEWFTTNAPIWWERMTDWGIMLMAKMQVGVMKGLSDFQDWLNQNPFFSFIQNWLGLGFDHVYTTSNSMGGQTTSAYINGVLTVLDQVDSAGARVGNSYLGGLARALDAHSPSRKAWGYGEDAVYGFVNGVQDNLGVITSAGQAMGQSLANGLKSEAQYVAEQVRAMMAKTTAEINGYMDYFTQQAHIKALSASQQIANATKDAAAALKQLGIDTSKVVGYGPNGELILEGVTKLPAKGGGSAVGGVLVGSGGNYVPAEKEKTTLAEALGIDKIAAETAVQSLDLLGGITLSVGDIGAAKDSIAKAAEASNQKLLDYAAGIGDFLTDTLHTAQNVFRRFASMEYDAIRADGDLKTYVTSEAYSAKQTVQSLYSGMKNTVADILGVSRGSLDVDSLSSGGLISRISALVSGTGSETDIELIGKLLQSAVDFRNTANYGLGRDYYTELLPNDPRLTGGNATTNNYNITLQGSNNANADVMSLVQLLGSLQPGAALP